MIDIEKVQEANTADEMRTEIHRLRHYNPMVRILMEMADYKGVSAKDRFTILAYNALKQNAALQALVLDLNNTREMPAMIVRDLLHSSIPDSTPESHKERTHASLQWHVDPKFFRENMEADFDVFPDHFWED
jgi:hypothetical protein